MKTKTVLNQGCFLGRLPCPDRSSVSWTKRPVLCCDHARIHHEPDQMLCHSVGVWQTSGDTACHHCVHKKIFVCFSQQSLERNVGDNAVAEVDPDVKVRIFGNNILSGKLTNCFLWCFGLQCTIKIACTHRCAIFILRSAMASFSGDTDGLPNFHRFAIHPEQNLYFLRTNRQSRRTGQPSMYLVVKIYTVWFSSVYSFNK